MRRRVLIVAASAVGVVLVALAITSAAALDGGRPAVRQQVLDVAVGAGADGAPVDLDATLFLPASAKPAPAVVLAHGFGESKDDESAEALDLASHGFVVLTYSARGFGHSTGQISLDSPQYEVADARRLIDLLATRPEVLLDAPGDPRVGFAGASYGGALSLLVAGYDKRVDAIVPSITWNNLAQALFPQMAKNPGPATTPAAVSPIGPGVFKRSWASIFFAGAPSISTSGAGSTCGRFTAAVCAAYQAAAVGGAPSPQILTLLDKSSPAGILSKIHAPTLLIQGEADSLFTLSEADANASGIAAAGTPVKEVWYAGGHDGGLPETNRLRSLTLEWFQRFLGKPGTSSRRSVVAGGGLRFEFSTSSNQLGSGQPATRAITRIADAPGFPGLEGNPAVATSTISVQGPLQAIVSPAGGSPSELTSLPGLGDLLGQLGAVGADSALSALPGQDALFDSARLAKPVHIVGSPSVSIHVTSSTSDATLFAKLVDVSASGQTTTLPQNLVSPIRLTGLGPAGRTVAVSLPAIVFDVTAGDSLRLVVSSTDQGFALPADPRTYGISLVDGVVTVPSVPSHTAGGAASTGLAAGGSVAVGLLAVAAASALGVRRRRQVPAPDAELERRTPLAISSLSKTYKDGFRAVDNIDFTVEHGAIVGLLGANGAGKTTTLRMVVGLIHPSAGSIYVFGHLIRPGSPVLSRVGAFIEGPGFLPHLSGFDNLTLYWRATGRPADDSELETALEIAGLGEEIHRKVRTYSHGMKQRLGIAQAMLGLPELLILDEPTNGLDPPQIRQMREVLVRYAATGRTVVVSSHLLAEVEQTCTHVVVMNRGRVLAQGRVTDMVGASGAVSFDVDQVERSIELLGAVDGVEDLVATSSGVSARLDGPRRSDIVRVLVGAGIRVERVASQRQLEDVFLALLEDS